MKGLRNEKLEGVRVDQLMEYGLLGKQKQKVDISGNLASVLVMKA